MKKNNFLNRHLIQSEENFFEHFLFSFTISLWLALASIALFLHSIFPFIFTATASKNVKKINEVMQKRSMSLTERKPKL